MVKILLVLFILLEFSQAEVDFEKACISCHKEEGIPDKGLYKRYLLKYSASTDIEEAMFLYLKNPTANKSAMPPRFINNFGLKKPSKLPDALLKGHIKTFIKHYDIKEKLYLPSPR